MTEVYPGLVVQARHSLQETEAKEAGIQELPVLQSKLKASLGNSMRTCF